MQRISFFLCSFCWAIRFSNFFNSLAQSFSLRRLVAIVILHPIHLMYGADARGRRQASRPDCLTQVSVRYRENGPNKVSLLARTSCASDDGMSSTVTKNELEYQHRSLSSVALEFTRVA